MTLRVCLNKSIFLLLSLSRELSLFVLHEHVLSLLVSKLCILSLHSLYKFHVSCFVFSHFNSLPPASLSLPLHFNCDFHDYLTRSRLTCIKCSSGINLLRYQFCVHEGIFYCRYNLVPLRRRLSVTPYTTCLFVTHINDIYGLFCAHIYARL